MSIQRNSHAVQCTANASGEMGERSHNQVQGLPPPPYDTLHDQGEMIYTAVERLAGADPGVILRG